MPKRNDIDSVMIIGSGPIIIGQACEFDYSGTQACKALRGLGYKIILINSNPATIMTDPSVADVTYIEPLNAAKLTEIIKKERPDALLPNLGGQSGLNLCLELHKSGALAEYGVRVIGVNLDAIERGEDRIEFKKTMDRLGIEMPESREARSVEQAEEAAGELGYPVVIRPAFTMGGTGGGLVFNKEELRVIAARGLQASIIGQILIEESVLGWEELEVEVVRDSDDRMIAVCMIENIDPMGVHTGDSFCAAPMLTVDEKLQQKLRRIAFDIVSDIGVIGGTNVQLAHDPATGRIVVIEINPRTSRSSALASKATGFPIAYVSALLAAGFTLGELPYWKEGTLDRYEPYGDYVVLKFARWAFEKFPGIEDKLGTQMRAVGEVMSIGRTFKEAFQKAVRSLEIGRSGLGFAKNFNELETEELLQKIAVPNSERYFAIYEALRKGVNPERIHEITKIKTYFLEQMNELVALENEILKYKKRVLPGELLIRAKKDGFADKYLSKLLDVPEEYIRLHRNFIGIGQEWDVVPVSGADAEYYYSTYNGLGKLGGELEASRAKRGERKKEDARKKVVVLGGGPNRIGQGIEFDYCCVHTALALRESGFETIMINCNPETVSTDYDTADKLYFEPLTVEDVLSICRREEPLGVIVQFGGQTPLNIAMELKNAGVPILGTTPEVIALAEDRDLFRRMMDVMGIPMPESAMARNYEEAVSAANKIGYPVMVRPSYVLGGRAMEVVFDDEQLRGYIVKNSQYIGNEAPILIDRFLENASECEADALADGTDAFVPAVMEHIEYAGIHSGDSACVIPPVSITGEQIETIREYTRRIAGELGAVGLMNVQYAVRQNVVYVLEANPRASRTVPIVSKVCGINMANLATKLIVGKYSERGPVIRLSEMRAPEINYYGVKEAVLPFNMFPEVDPVLGPEMRSTGEVLGLADSFGLAFYKALEGSRSVLPLSGSVLISVAKKDREKAAEAAKQFEELGFKIVATRGTHAYLTSNGIAAEVINKIYEGRPNIEDAIKNHQLGIIVNTPSGSKRSSDDDSYIRKAAIRYNVPYMTTLTAALAGAKGIAEKIKTSGESVRSLQEHHRRLLM